MRILNHAKRIVKSLTPLEHRYKLTKVKNFLTGYAARSYSQEGEDMILRRIFERQEKGFYVDVGAHHPKRFSNTYYFYRKGWRGINIDAMPGSMRAFNKVRPRDINLEMAVSSKEEKLVYYAFTDPAFNGLSKDLSLDRDGKDGNKIIFTKELETVSLQEVLGQHVPQGVPIDFLSVDVEGLDFDVLKSNNWSKYHAKVILAESAACSLEDVASLSIYDFLKQKGYRLLAKTVNTLIFIAD